MRMTCRDLVALLIDDLAQIDEHSRISAGVLLEL
jgi:hypothetical protein